MSRFTLLPVDRLKEYEQKVREGNSYLLDVREKGEYDAGHIPLAISRPLSQLEDWYSELDKERTVIVYCRTINRARRSAEQLSSRGFREVLVLDGGYNVWNRTQGGWAPPAQGYGTLERSKVVTDLESQETILIYSAHVPWSLTPHQFNTICIGILIATIASAMALAALTLGEGSFSGDLAAVLIPLEENAALSLGLSIIFMVAGLGLLWKYAATEADGAQWETFSR
jgi:rhodanese-related sulfurtransferase